MKIKLEAGTNIYNSTPLKQRTYINGHRQRTSSTDIVNEHTSTDMHQRTLFQRTYVNGHHHRTYINGHSLTDIRQQTRVNGHTSKRYSFLLD